MKSKAWSKWTGAALIAVTVAMGPVAVHAQPAPIRLEAAGTTSRTQLGWKQWEWFGQELERRTNGRVKVRIRTIPELGVSGFEMIRTMKAGLLDIGDVQPAYVSGDLPVVEGQDIPGIYKTLEAWRDGHLAWAAVLKQNEEKMGGKYLGSYSFAWNLVYSRKAVETLDDLKGMKIRTFGTAFPVYLKTLGANPVVIPFAEAYTAMERGTVDAIQTTIESGLTLKLNEVAKYLVDLQLGSGPGTLVVGRKTWDKLPADVQKIMIEVGDEFTTRSWSAAIQASRDMIIAHEKVGMKFIPVKEAWKPAFEAASREVIANWLKRTGSDGERAFNQHLAPIVGFKVSTP